MTHGMQTWEITCDECGGEWEADLPFDQDPDSAGEMCNCGSARLNCAMVDDDA